MTTRIEVDFNSRDAAGMVPALVEDAEGPLRVGDFVEAFDDEGYRCLSVVASVQGDMLALDPVWNAFAAPDEARVVIAGAPSTMWTDWKNRLTVGIWPVAIARPIQPSTGPVEFIPA
jgi:hypothetical protein